MSFSPSPSPRKRANTVDSPTKAWNVSAARTPVERPLSALRSPMRPPSNTPSRIGLPPSSMPKFDLSTAIPKAPSPIRTIRGSPKKEVHEYEVPIFDFSMRGNTAQKPAVLRRKPLMATAGQAASHIASTAKTSDSVVDMPDKTHPVKAAVVPEPVSAVVLRVMQAQDVPLPASTIAAPSSQKLNRKKQPHEVPLPETPGLLACLKRGPAKSVSPPGAPLSFTAFASARVPTKPTMRANHMRSSSEVSQRSIASLQKLSPGTMMHVAPQLLEKPAAKIGPSAAGATSSKRKERQAARAAAAGNVSSEQQALKSAVEGRGFGLSPTKAAKPPAVYVGPAKARMAAGNGNIHPQSPAAGSPKVERQMVDREVLVVSRKPMTLQTKLQVSPRNVRAGTASPKTVSPAPKPMGQFTKPIPFGVLRGGEIQMPASKTRNVSDSTSAAGADDERGTISNPRPELGHKISESEAHVLAIDSKINHRKPFAGRRSNCVSNSVISNSSKHHESIEYQAKQYIVDTISKTSLLDVDDETQKKFQKSPLIKSSPIKEKKMSAAEEAAADEARYQMMIKKAYSDPEEDAYQAMIKKAYIDERPKFQVNLGRPRSRHRHGSSGQTQIGASQSREDTSSEFSVDFLNADKSQHIILETFTKLNTAGSRCYERSMNQSQFDPVREPVSPSKKTKLADGGNFARRMDKYPLREPVWPSKKTKLAGGRNFANRKDVSPSKRVHTLELELPVMSSHGLGFHLSSDHPLSPLKDKGKQPIMSSADAMLNDDPFEHFDDISLDDVELAVKRACQGTSIEELDKRAAEMESRLDTMQKSKQYEIDNDFVDKAAELGLMVEEIEKSQQLQQQVDNQLMHEMAHDATKSATKVHSTADATTVMQNNSMEMNQKSSINTRHHATSMSSHKSVRWHPSLDLVSSVDSPTVQEKVAENASMFVPSVPMSAAELELQNLFVPDAANLAADEAIEFALLAKSLKAQKSSKNPEFARLLRKLREEIEKDDFSLPAEVVKGLGNVPGKVDNKLSQVHASTVGAGGPAPKWNPTVPEFTPRNVKENLAWVPEQGLDGQRAGMATSNDVVDAWSKPTVVHDGPFEDPAILSVSPGRKNLLRDPAILSVSPGRMRAMRGGEIGWDYREQSMSENFADSLFSAGAVGDPAIMSIGRSPARHQRATSHQTSGTAGETTSGTATLTAPAMEKTTSNRKRVIWDNPDEPGGREVIIESKKYAEEYLSAFVKNYPLTGQKARVLPKKKLEDLPKRYEEAVHLGVAGGFKPQKLSSEAADIQQKLELLLLRKKEVKVRTERESSGSGAGWGLPAMRAADAEHGVLGVGKSFEE